MKALKTATLICPLALLIFGCASALSPDVQSFERGKAVYLKECAACHGASGYGADPDSPATGLPAPDLVGLRARNDGYFPREFVRRFVLGLLEKDPGAAMPDFGKVGLRHVYPEGGADGEVLETDFQALLNYLEAIQE